MAKSDKDRQQELRDKEKADGIKKITHKLTATEASWAEMYMAEQGYSDMTEWLLDHIPAHIKAKCQEIKNGMHTGDIVEVASGKVMVPTHRYEDFLTD